MFFGFYPLNKARTVLLKVSTLRILEKRWKQCWKGEYFTVTNSKTCFNGIRKILIINSLKDIIIATKGEISLEAKDEMENYDETKRDVSRSR